MTIDALHASSTVTAHEWETLTDVAARMRFNDVGSAAVVHEHELTGIITERDLVRAIADGADVTRAIVGDYMTRSPVVMDPGTATQDAARTMAKMGVEHLPVVDGGNLIGVTSIRDLILDLIALPNRP